MLKGYNVKNARSLFDPASKEAFRVSRSKIDLFLECERCFYLDQRLGIARPRSFPLTLNIAVDELLKKEFDILRQEQKPHAIMEKYNIDAVPLRHQGMEAWRDALRRGIEYRVPETNLSIRGGVDDVWVTPDGKFVIVDYKAKATRDEISLDGDLGDQYKRQMEVYQWLFRKNNFSVFPKAYFLFVNVRKDVKKLDGKLEFDMSIIVHEGSDEWVETAVKKIYACLMSGEVPEANEDCEYCGYRKEAGRVLQQKYQEQKQSEQKKHASTSDATLF